MKNLKTGLLIGVFAAMGAVPVIGQIHKYFTPGTIWTVTMVRMTPGMDQTYLQYLDSQFKKSEDAQVKAGFQQSYKILRTSPVAGQLAREAGGTMMSKRSLIAPRSLTDPSGSPQDSASTQAPTHKEYQ